MKGNPRYAIVRVDNRCPVEEEENIYLTDRIKMFPCFNDKRLSCKKCNYGDTKEQLIRKVAQVLIWKADEIRALKAYKLSREAKKVLDEEYFDLARKIVEFLGVK